MATPQLMAPLSPFLLGPMWLPELSWPLWGSACPQLLCAELQFPHGAHNCSVLSSSFPMVPTAPSTSDPAKSIPPSLPESNPCCEQNSGTPGAAASSEAVPGDWKPIFSGGFPPDPVYLPPCKPITMNQNALPERVGKGYVNVEVTLWLVCTVHTEAQSSRVPTACCKCKDCKKLSKTNNILILFRFSTLPTSRSVQQQHQSPRVRLSITPRTQSIAIHYSCTLPKCQYREPEDLKPCCFT